MELFKVQMPDGRVLHPAQWTSTIPLWSSVDINDGRIPVLSAFSYALGQEVPGSFGPRKSTLVDTNMEGQGGTLLEHEEFYIYSMAIEVYLRGASYSHQVFTNPGPPAVYDNVFVVGPDVSVHDMLRLQRSLIVKFVLANQREITRQPLSVFPAASGVLGHHGFVGPTAANAFPASVPLPWSQIGHAMIANNGGVDAVDGRPFASPIHIAGGEAFQIDIYAADGEVEDLVLIDSSSSESRFTLRVVLDGFRKLAVS